MSIYRVAICLTLILAGTALAQPTEGFSPTMPFGTPQGSTSSSEGFSPTLPFGTSGMSRQQAPANSPGYSPYNNYNYYYGPYGAYSNGAYRNGTYRNNSYAPRVRTYRPRSSPSQYKGSNSQGPYRSQFDINNIPGYNSPLEQHSLPGY